LHRAVSLSMKAVSAAMIYLSVSRGVASGPIGRGADPVSERIDE